MYLKRWLSNIFIQRNIFLQLLELCTFKVVYNIYYDEFKNKYI